MITGTDFFSKPVSYFPQQELTRKSVMNVYNHINEVTPFIRPFPANEDVFFDHIDNHAEHLLPLVSVDLSAINSEWSGWIHFVSSIEPYDGVVGEYTGTFYNYYTRKNFFAFDIVDGRYKFRGDFRYFYLENGANSPVLTESYKNHRFDLEKHYKETRESYRKSKEEFQEYGAIFHPFAETDSQGKLKDKDHVSFVDNLNGKPWGSNWACEDFPMETEIALYDDEEGLEGEIAFPLTEDGRRFHYIGTVEGNYYYGADTSVLLFYDPQERIALVTFDWT